MIISLSLSLLILGIFVVNAALEVGTGIYDITGPSVEINFMGYALPGQRGQGIHQRLRARAFAFNDGTKHFVFISVDGGMASDLVKMKVLDRLNEQLGENVYTDDNLAFSGTHTHSGPAGFLQYVLYQVTSLGFVQETLDAWVEGISQAVVMAHHNLQGADIYLSQGKLYDSNINRSPTSYLLNPEDEQEAYEDGDTDKNMFLLNFVAASLKNSKGDDEPPKQLGSLNWFAVHGTSMNNTNTLVSGDNKGYASYLLEREINGPDVSVGHGSFVAAFASTNLGDVSPNTMGAKCIDTGLACDGTTSSCNGRCENCIAFGPGPNGDMVQSAKIIGQNQFEHAKNLIKSPEREKIDGSVDYRHSFVDMSTLKVTLSSDKFEYYQKVKDAYSRWNTTHTKNTAFPAEPSKILHSEEEINTKLRTTTVTLCSPAMGYSFAAGTTDGPGMFGFTQGTTSGNPFWDKVRDFLSEPTEEEVECQAPKPILLNTGDVAKPYEWDPRIVPVQILKVGQVYILSAPCELTTMAGRRLRKAVKESLLENSPALQADEVFVTIAGLTNTYSSYVTTFEEYQAQRYEAASTIFGPYTLDGYIQEFTRLARDMALGAPSESGPPPPDLTDVMLQFMPLPSWDRCPRKSGESKSDESESERDRVQTADEVTDATCFGTVVEGKDVLTTLPYKVGQQVQASFHGANPRNNPRAQGTFLTVEKVLGLGRTEVIARDGDWDTTFKWVAGPEDPLDLGIICKRSEATLSFNVTDTVKPGNYKLCYSGDHKLPSSNGDKAIPFMGCSAVFTVGGN